MKPLNQSRRCPRCKELTAYYDSVVRSWRCPCGWRERQATRSVMVGIGLALAILAPVGASAQDLGGWTDAETAAKAAAAGEKAKALEQENAALKAESAELRAGRDAALKLVEITEKLAEAQERLRQLAEQERDAYKTKAERLEKDKGKGELGLRVQARAGAGALAGMAIAPVFPPAAILGPAVGALVGLVEHLLVSGL